MSFGVSRRDVLALGVGGAAALAFAGTAHADKMKDAVSAFAGDAEIGEGSVSVDAPEIAENGNSVPIEVSVDGEVDEVLILASGNPSPGVATFKFGPLAGEARAATRIRLAKTQDVVAYAKMKDGSVQMASRTVKVTIGGCGG